MNHSGHRRFVTLTACCIASLMLAAGCSSSPAAEGAGPTSGAAASAAAVDELAALQEFAALPVAEQQAQLQAVTERVDRQLMTMSGLEDELGGPAKADAAYAALSAVARQFGQNLVDEPNFGKFGAFVRSEDAPTQGGMMFGNFMMGNLMQDAAVNAAKDIAPGTKSVPESEDLRNPPSGGKGAIELEGDVAKSSLGVGGEFTVDGITGKLKTVITVAPCPDPKGQFTSTTTMTASVTNAGGRTGTNLTIEMSIKGQVDDDAQLVSYDVDTRTQSAKFENSKGQFVDQTVGWTVGGKDFSNFRGRVNRTGGNVAPGFAEDQAKWSTFTAMMLQEKAVEAAKKGWQSGRCVALDPTTSPSKRTGLKPSASVTITAAPRSKIDGAAVGGTVKGALNGGSSLDPAGSKVPADATFTYVAPDQKDKSATVSLEARSKRGVAKAEVVFDTKAGGYDLKGSIATAPGGTRITGQTCDVTKPFTAESSGDMIGTITFTPTSDVAGTVGFTGMVGNAPFKLTGKGTYTVNVPPGSDSGTLDWKWAVTISIPKIGSKTNPGVASIAMTPAAGC
jgi:hypothetical protein